MYKRQSTKWVKNTNEIHLSVKVDTRNGRIIILSVIDNLIEEISIDRISDKANVALLCLPNGISSTLTRGLLEKGVKVIDLSADYRYKSLDQWKNVYSSEAKKYKRDDDDLCKEAVYGLPEINFKDISKASLIACPGCYPTSALIPLVPFLSQGIIDNEGIVIDSKSGTSGGGREPHQKLLFLSLIHI